MSVTPTYTKNGTVPTLDVRLQLCSGGAGFEPATFGLCADSV